VHGSTVTVGLLMAAMPFGMVVGAFVLAKMATPSTRMRMMGWLAILSCVPLIGSAPDPPPWCVLLLWTLAGAGGAYQLAATPAFVQALRPGPGRSAWRNPACTPSGGSASWRAGQRRRRSAPRSPTAWPA
jgi:MFS family permease